MVVSTCGMLLAALCMGSGDSAIVAVDVDPARVTLCGSDQSAQVVVTGRSAAGSQVDLTAFAQFASQSDRVALVGADGLIRPTGDGETIVEATVEGRIRTVEVRVVDYVNSRTVGFVSRVVPILTRYGCNSGTCHGKASGQNGFRLSLLGFDPKADYDAIVYEGQGRRIFPSEPRASLLVRKATAELPHGGGRKFAVDSPEANLLARFIGQGMAFDCSGEPELTRLEVRPDQRTLKPRGRQQLRVIAHYGDGTEVDVTRLAQYQSNAEDLAEVDPSGVVQVIGGVGEAAIMARFAGEVGVARALIPREGSEGTAFDEPPTGNLVDPLVAGKLRELNLRPSPACSDAEFARRTALDLGGVLPKPAEVVAFEADSRPDKRARWVEGRIERPEYADLFALKWSAILKNKRELGDVSRPRTFGFHAWIRQSIAENKPYDRFATEIVSARGEASVHPAVAWYQRSSTVEQRADDSAQLFLGVRIQCARCHHHPYERWSQDDYYGFASLFARVGTRAGSASGIFNLPNGLATNPVTGKPRPPRPLGGAELSDLGPTRDPRASLVKWLRQPENPYFAQALVNRYWKHFLGRGLVEPEDDLRATNPPTNPELLGALADDFVRHGYDLNRLVRTIATSRAYGRSSQPNAANEADRRNFARFYPRRLPAEVLLDAIDNVAGTREAFRDLPAATRAVQLPDEGFPSPFLDVFGRPKRESVCECERSAEANLSQTLHLLNSDQIQGKLTDKAGRAARLAEDKRPESEKVDELFRLAFARAPTEAERGEVLAFLDRKRAAGTIQTGYEDLIWTLINTKEFLFVD